MRYKLKHTWSLFFSRYSRLTEVQEKTIPLVLAKQDALVISPTASGKTEAVIVPIIELLLSEKWTGLSVVYISPTKALCNDLYLRLRELCQELNVEVTIKTGDRPRFKKQSQGILITTPESFDSLLCRHSQQAQNIRSLIIDEIHLLDNTYRGDQLRMLVKRTVNISNNPVNTYMLSATVSQPKTLAARYSEAAKVIEIKGNRKIKSTFVKSLAEILPYTRKEGLRKLLIFCNSRMKVEIIANRCKVLWGDHNVVAHHGSLSTKVRHEAESFMKENYFGVCVSTMTLEIGIDIGNLDAVILADVPLSLSSLLQRIGRSNRRSGEIRAFALSGSDRSKIALDRMFEAARNGELEINSYRMDYGVVIQQIFSMLYAFPRGVEETRILEFLLEYCPKNKILQILSHLYEQGWVEKVNDSWKAATNLMNQGAIGKIHSNIPDKSACKVVNITNKMVIGEVTGSVNIIFILAGRIWRIVHRKSNTIFVKPASGNKFKTRFKTTGSESKFSYLLPPDFNGDS